MWLTATTLNPHLQTATTQHSSNPLKEYEAAPLPMRPARACLQTKRHGRERGLSSVQNRVRYPGFEPGSITELQAIVSMNLLLWKAITLTTVLTARQFFWPASFCIKGQVRRATKCGLATHLCCPVTTNLHASCSIAYLSVCAAMFAFIQGAAPSRRRVAEAPFFFSSESLEK